MGATQALFRNRAEESSSNLLSIFLAGVFSGWVVCHITCPMHNVKVQQQIVSSRLRLEEAAHRVGMRGLFRGYIPHAMMESVGRGWYMVGFVSSKRALGVDAEGSALGKRLI